MQFAIYLPPQVESRPCPVFYWLSGLTCTEENFVLKAGARNHEEVAAELAGNPGAHLVELVRYIDRMDHAYAAADIGIFRAGAGTVAELAVVELPSVLVPFPHDEHDEQFHNAQPLVDAGGALLVRDHEATPERVGPMLEERLADRGSLEAMATGMRASARPQAAADSGDRDHAVLEGSLLGHGANPA